MKHYNENNIVTDSKVIEDAFEMFLKCDTGYFIVIMQGIAHQIVTKYFHELAGYIFDLDSYINKVVLENRIPQFDIVTVFEKACNNYIIVILKDNFHPLLYRYTKKLINENHMECSEKTIIEIIKKMTVEHTFELFLSRIQSAVS